MKIQDLKSIKIPSKTVKVKVITQQVDIQIYPITGFGLMKIQDLSSKLQKDNNIDIQKQLIEFSLKYGCKAQDDDVNYLIQNDIIACMALVKQIVNYSSDFNEKKIKQSDIAKKK